MAWRGLKCGVVCSGLVPACGTLRVPLRAGRGTGCFPDRLTSPVTGYFLPGGESIIRGSSKDLLSHIPKASQFADSWPDEVLR